MLRCRFPWRRRLHGSVICFAGMMPTRCGWNSPSKSQRNTPTRMTTSFIPRGSSSARWRSFARLDIRFAFPVDVILVQPSCLHEAPVHCILQLHCVPQMYCRDLVWFPCFGTVPANEVLLLWLAAKSFWNKLVWRRSSGAHWQSIFGYEVMRFSD